MSQAAELVDLLKRRLRDRGMTYAVLAPRLGLSESSVKRLFSRKRLSLERLEQVCRELGMDIADLLEDARAAQPRIAELTEAQERQLVADQRLLLTGLLALSHWSAEEMVAHYSIEEAEVVRLLARLDRMGILDLMPGNRIKLRLASNFAWRKGGPLERFFESRVQAEFFRSSFHGRGESRFVVHAGLSERSNALLRQRMARLAEEFAALAEEDSRVDHRMLAGTTLVLAMRPWEMEIFRHLRRADGSL